MSHPLWTEPSVTEILKNRMYCGDMVQGRWRIKSYKIHTQERVPEEEWYVAENTHPPIVGRADFARAQALLNRRTRTGPGRREPYLFGGLLRCADCGRAMSRSKVGGNVYYYCRTYKEQSKTACTRHSIREGDLESAVLRAIREQLERGVDGAAVLDAVDRLPVPDGPPSADRDLARTRKELARLSGFRQSAWEDWKSGGLTDAEYHRMREEYGRRISQLEGIAETLERERTQRRSAPEPPLLAAFRGGGTLDRLTRDILVALVEEILVEEGGSIRIRFRFSDPLGGAAGQGPGCSGSGTA